LVSNVLLNNEIIGKLNNKKKKLLKKKWNKPRVTRLTHNTSSIILVVNTKVRSTTIITDI